MIGLIKEGKIQAEVKQLVKEKLEEGEDKND